MSIFDPQAPSEPEADKLARGFQMEADQIHDSNLLALYNAVERFWFRNKDADGNPIAIAGADPQPTGIEILESMGLSAQAFMGVAYSRYQMVSGINSAFGLDPIDDSRGLPPYDLAFNADGSIDSANSTLKPEFVSPVNPIDPDEEPTETPQPLNG